VSTYTVKDDRGHVRLETDDWVEALTAAETRNWPKDRTLHVTGTHPTHEWGPPHEGQNSPGTRRCAKCDGWDNGSYGSQAPCGYDFGGQSLWTALEREKRAREAVSQDSETCAHCGLPVFWHPDGYADQGGGRSCSARPTGKPATFLGHEAQS
jgi:hypothetical protein